VLQWVPVAMACTCCVEE